ncbi:MAG: exodeoxyribonuclease VII large subunit [Bacteroidia bacterium]|nr:exodeoxyribonuclease VII large subunit [Bacteroidia bacterium]
MSIQTISLYELNNSIKTAISGSFPEASWVIAEISELSVNRNGHCYLELIEKNADNTQIIAKARATIWAFTFRMLKPYFETSTGHEFISGLKVLLNVTIEFHELYGLTLNVKDIDPTYTLGDIEKKKKEILDRLEKEGVINMNKEIELPEVPQKIAIISSETAAGYGDFINQLENNPYSYKFYHKLFPASMQGENTENSIIEALDKIYRHESFFDAVAIIRGGGSKSDLISFDSYWLAYHITQFPLPVITGIGHERDDTIVDIVAHTKCKTPTAVAEFLIDKVSEFENRLLELQNNIIENTESLLQEANDEIGSLTGLFAPIVHTAIQNENNGLAFSMHKIKTAVARYFEISNLHLEKYPEDLKWHAGFSISDTKNNLKMYSYSLQNSLKKSLAEAKHRIEIFNTKNRHLDPSNVLRRGYSITFSKGKVLKTTDGISEGEEVDTVLYNGTFKSRIIKK